MVGVEVRDMHKTGDPAEGRDPRDSTSSLDVHFRVFEVPVWVFGSFATVRLAPRPVTAAASIPASVRLVSPPAIHSLCFVVSSNEVVDDVRVTDALLDLRVVPHVPFLLRSGGWKGWDLV